MGDRRRSSGFWETVVKSTFGVGTTVHRKKDWIGREKTIVKHHDSGKTKEYTHGAGIFGNKTKVRTTDRHGEETSRGQIKENIWGSRHEETTHSNGRKSKKKFNAGIFGNKDKLRTYDQQGKLDGCGETKRSLITGGTSSYYEGTCWSCDGTGVFPKNSKPCRKCGGTGIFRRQRR